MSKHCFLKSSQKFGSCIQPQSHSSICFKLLVTCQLWKKKNNALITLQCCVIVTHCNETNCAMAWCMDIEKTRTANILCPCSSIVCANILCPHSSIVCVVGGNKQGKKNEEKGKEKEIKVNLILCHLCPMIPMGPYAFRHHCCTLFFSF